MRKNRGELPALEQTTTQSCALGSRPPSSVGVMWGGRAVSAPHSIFTWLLHPGPWYVLLWLPSPSGPTCPRWVAADLRGLLAAELGDGRRQSDAQDAAVQTSLTCWSISYLSMAPSLGLWSFFNRRAGGPGHARGSAHPGSTSLYPGRSQAATGMKAGGGCSRSEGRACGAPPLGTRSLCEGALPSRAAGWCLAEQGQDSMFPGQLPPLPPAALARAGRRRVVGVFRTAAGSVAGLVALSGGSWLLQGLAFPLVCFPKERRAEGSTITTALHSGVHQPSPQGGWLNPSASLPNSVLLQIYARAAIHPQVTSPDAHFPLCVQSDPSAYFTSPQVWPEPHRQSNNKFSPCTNRNQQM